MGGVEHLPAGERVAGDERRRRGRGVAPKNARLVACGVLGQVDERVPPVVANGGNESVRRSGRRVEPSALEEPLPAARVRGALLLVRRRFVWRKT